MAFVQVRAMQHVGQRQHQFAHIHAGHGARDDEMRRGRAADEHVALKTRQVAETFGGVLEALVLLQPANQLGGRIVGFLFGAFRARQQ